MKQWLQAERTIQKADMPLIGMSGVPQVSVGIVGWAM